MVEDGEVEDTVEEVGREEAAVCRKPGSRKKRVKQTYYMQF